MNKILDQLERYSRWITLTVFVAGFFIFLFLPVMAISWRNRPFPGFMVEHTLIVNGTRGNNWTGAQAGLSFPERITRISGTELSDPGLFTRTLSARQVGDSVSFITEQEDGSQRLYPSVRLMNFPSEDFFRLFWVPYLIGLIYFLIGIWVYLVRGRNTLPGRALAFFCAVTALSVGLIFETSTTHGLVSVWVGALSFAGGALVSLAMRFPVEWRMIRRRPWLLAIPYVPSGLLTAWGFLEIYFPSTPWAYIQNWGVIYRYTGFGVLFFLSLVIFQSFTNESDLVRRQSRIVLLGGFLAFLPITYFFIAPLFNIQVEFNGLIFLPSLVFFPFSVTVAITRYRLLEIDTIVNRAVVYGTLTAAIGGLFTALVLLVRYFFVITTGEKNDIALVITTFVVASLFNPIKERIQKIVDRQFKHTMVDLPELSRFADQLHGHLQFFDGEAISRKFLLETARSLEAKAAQLIIYQADLPVIKLTTGKWDGKIISSIPLVYMEDKVGLLLLGQRENRRSYTPIEVALVQKASRDVAMVIHNQYLSSTILHPNKPDDHEAVFFNRIGGQQV